MTEGPGSPAPGGSLGERARAAVQVFVADPAAPVLETADAHHLLRVLRLRPGEVVVAADGAGRWCRCRLSARGGRGNDLEDLAPADLLEVDGPLHEDPSPTPVLTVAFAPVKGDRPEWVVQKLTEVGIDRIVPLVTERSVVRWDGSRADRNVERLRRIAREAAAQCRRTFLPEVSAVTTLADLGPGAGGEPGAWLAEPGGPPLGDTTTVVAVGPEGGWSPSERAGARGLVGLGPTILRAETAALVAGALMSALRAGAVGPAAAPRRSGVGGSA